MIAIPNYQISIDLQDFSEAAFSENPAYKTIWENADLNEVEVAEAFGKVIQSKKLFVELAEYCILEHFSTFICDYYNTRKITEKTISYSGKDIPDVLLNNRFMKLFSEDPTNRAAFCINNEGFFMEEESVGLNTGSIIYMSGRNGAKYRRFDLTIPKGSKVFRENNNTIVIDTKLFTFKYKVFFDGFSSFVEDKFECYYLYKQKNSLFKDWLFNVEVSVKYKNSALLKLWDWKYYNWLDEYLLELSNYCDVTAFYKRIGWDQAKTIIQIMKAPKAGMKQS